MGSSAAAEESIQALPCRPTVACTADIVPPGVAEVETGVHTRFATGATLAAPVLGKLSLSEWFQAQVGTIEATSADHGVFADVLTVLGKFVVVHQGARTPSVAFTIGFAAAVNRETRDYAPSQGLQAAGLVSRDFDKLHVDLNGGYSAIEGDGRITHSGWGALATSFAWTRRLASFHEVYYLQAPRPRVAGDAGFLFGLAYAVRPEIVVDLGVDVGFMRAERTSSAFFGFTVILGRVFEGARAPQVARARGMVL